MLPCVFKVYIEIPDTHCHKEPSSVLWWPVWGHRDFVVRTQVCYGGASLALVRYKVRISLTTQCVVIGKKKGAKTHFHHLSS